MKAEYNGIYEKFKGLISEYGEKNALDIFFNDIECELDGSTIDYIRDDEQNMVFFYNGNTNDFDTIGAFDLNELETFYNELKVVLEEKRKMVENNKDYVEEYINKRMIPIISDAHDRNEFVSNIIETIICDIIETADPINWNDSDIDIALARTLVNGTY